MSGALYQTQQGRIAHVWKMCRVVAAPRRLFAFCVDDAPRLEPSSPSPADLWY
jgi:hypothetical protein